LEGQCKAIYERGSSTGIFLFATLNYYICTKREIISVHVLWPRIYSTCRKHFPVLFSFMTYHRVSNYINTTGVSSGAGTAYPSEAPWLTTGFAH
jgi:hypothetical protein